MVLVGDLNRRKCLEQTIIASLHRHLVVAVAVAVVVGVVVIIAINDGEGKLSFLEQKQSASFVNRTEKQNEKDDEDGKKREKVWCFFNRDKKAVGETMFQIVV